MISPTDLHAMVDSHVGADGTCFLPYLHAWNGSCNVIELLQTMQGVFSANCPVYARPPASQPTPSSYQQPAQTYQQPQTYQPQASQPQRPASAVRHCLCLVSPLPSWRRHCLCLVFPLPSCGGQDSAFPCGPQAAGQYAQPQYAQPQHAQQSAASTETERLRNTVKERLRKKLDDQNAAMSAELRKLMATQEKLETGKDAIAKGMQDLQIEKQVRDGRLSLCVFTAFPCVCFTASPCVCSLPLLACVHCLSLCVFTAFYQCP